ncbi:hypothetical protein D3C84_304980 [compost metagenome]
MFNVKHPLFSLLPGIGAKVILITTSRLVVLARRYGFLNDPAQCVIGVADLHIVIVTIEQWFAVEQRMLKGNDFLYVFVIDQVIETGQGFDRLQHTFVEIGTVELTVGVVGDGGFVVQGYRLALDAAMQECIARLIGLFEHRALQLGRVAASHLRQNLSLDRQPVVQVTAGQRWQ